MDEEQKTVFVSRTKGGVPPLFAGGAGRTHTRVRQRMRQLLESTETPPYLDEVALRFLNEGRANYLARGLSEAVVVDLGQEALLLTWLGDSTNEALAAMLNCQGYVANAAGPGVEVHKKTQSNDDILRILTEIAAGEPPSLATLLGSAQNLQREKWDWSLPDPLLFKTYASLRLNLSEALSWARALQQGRPAQRGATPPAVTPVPDSSSRRTD